MSATRSVKPGAVAFIAAFVLFLVQEGPRAGQQKGADAQSDKPSPTSRKSKSNPPSDKPSQSTQAPHAEQKPPEQALTPHAPDSEAVTSNAQEKRDKKTSSDWWLVWFTGGLIIVGACQLIAMLVQAYWMRRTVAVAKTSADAATATVNAMRETAISQLRAYVFPVRASGLEKNGKYYVKVVVKNSGQTPAYDCVAGCGVGISTYPVPAPYPPDSAQGKYSVGPNSEIELGGDLGSPFTHAACLAISSSTHAIYAFGSIQYVDAFRQKRVTNFRMFCTGEALEKGRFSFCQDGNDAD
jgi:hypothetical protein